MVKKEKVAFRNTKLANLNSLTIIWVLGIQIGFHAIGEKGVKNGEKKKKRGKGGEKGEGKFLYPASTSECGHRVSLALRIACPSTFLLTHRSFWIVAVGLETMKQKRGKEGERKKGF